MRFVLSSRIDRGLLPLILADQPAEAGEINVDPTRLLSYLEAQLGLAIPEQHEVLRALRLLCKLDVEGAFYVQLA